MLDDIRGLYYALGKAQLAYNKHMQNKEQDQSTATVILSDTDASSDLQQRHFLAVFFLSFLWGTFGVDRFYLGKIGTGIAKLLTFGGFGVWVIIDLVLIMSGSMTDSSGRPMREYARYKKFAVKTVILFAVASGAIVLITGGVAIYAISEFVMNVLNQGPNGLENLLPGGLSPTDVQGFESLSL